MQDKLRALEDRYEALTEEMGQPEIVNDYQRLQVLAKERATLEQVVQLFRSLRGVEEQVEEARLMADDADEEISSMAQEELASLEKEQERLQLALRSALLPVDPRDDRNVIVEVRAGTGGEEASLFASELYRMYSRYAEQRRWPVEVISFSESDKGGFKEIVFEVQRPRRLLAPQVRERRPPRAARAGHGGAGPHPHLDRYGRGAARGRRGRAGDQRERLARRYLPLGRRRRPER